MEGEYKEKESKYERKINKLYLDKIASSHIRRQIH